MKRKPLKPLIRSGGYLPSDDYTPLVYSGGKTTREVPSAKDNSADKESSESKNKSNGEN